MIDFSLTEEQLALQKLARNFAEKEIKPVSAARDRIQDPDQCSNWDIIAKAGELGLTKMLRPAKYGGLGLGALDWVIMLEEFGAADIGIATTMILLEPLKMVVLESATEEQLERWLPEVISDEPNPISIAVTEPNRAGSDLMCPIPDPALGLTTRARLEGDEWVISGAKSAFVSNAGPNTKTFLVGARTDMSKPQKDTLSIFYVPADTPGLSLGKQTDKIGLRLIDHAQVYFDDVRIPKNNLLGRVGGSEEILPPTIRMSNIGICASAVGMARAACEYALDYAKNRKSWGQPIINHQAVAMMMTDMHIDMEAARFLAWNAAWATDNFPFGGMHIKKGGMAKIFGTEMAVRVTEKAMNVLGAYGLSREYPVEKWHRDALSGPIEDIHNILWRLRVAAQL